MILSVGYWNINLILISTEIREMIGSEVLIRATDYKILLNVL